MHLVGLALKPPKKSADPVPTVIVVIIVRFAGPFLALDDKLLIGLGQFVERNVDIDLFSRAGPQQIFVGLTKLFPPKDAHHAFLDA